MEMRESNRNIFIVHGRDNAMKEDVAGLKRVRHE